jgi:hypothetical protein
MNSHLVVPCAVQREAVHRRHGTPFAATGLHASQQHEVPGQQRIIACCAALRPDDDGVASEEQFLTGNAGGRD